ncbi:MAG: hypothetical protein PHI63_01835 [Patescibacteria group bacterium]|nr:hypothetical protein [Patescibacteria group bacterium]
MPPTPAPLKIPLPPAAPVDPFNAPSNPPPPDPGVLPPTLRPLKKSSRGIFPLLIVFVAMLACGGVAAAYFFWVNQQPKGQPPTPASVETPDSVLQGVISAWSEVKSFHGEYDLTLTLKAATSSDLAQELASARIPDNQLTATLNTSFDVSLDAAAPASAITAQVNIPTPDAIPFNGVALTPRWSLVQTGTTTVYFRLQNLQISGFDFSSINNQWVRLNTEELAALPGMSPEITPQQDAEARSLEQRMREFYQQNPFIVADKLDPADPIDGVPTRRLTLALDRERFKNFINSAWDEWAAPLLVSIEGVPKPSADSIINIDAISASGEVWATQPDNQLRRFTARVTYVIPGKEEGSSEGTFSATMDARFSRFNEPVSVTLPGQAMSYREFAMQVQLIMASALTPGSDDMTSDRDGDGLTDLEEGAVYGTNPDVADTDGDGYSDGNEVKNGYNPNGPGKLPAFSE